jgi:uncharacterized membrane protein YbhN (UPF0104 family)
VAAGLTIACLAILIAGARLPALEDATGAADWRYLGLACVLCLLTIACKAARWRALYPDESRPGLGLAVAGIAVGQVANWAVPARAGEALRLGLVSADGSQGVDVGRGAARGVGVLVAEKLLDGVMLLLASALLVALGGLPAWLNVLGILAVAALGASGLAFVLLLRGGQRVITLPRHLRLLLAPLRGLAEGALGWVSPAGAVAAILWSLGAWGLGGAMNALVLAGLGLDAGPGPTLAVLVALYGGAIVPSLPGRVGVFQYLCVLALVPFGVDFDRALAFSVALYAAVYLPPIGVGLLSALLVRKRIPGALG